MMQTSELKPMPPFINDKFALKVLLDMGGKATWKDIRAHVANTYDVESFPHALQYLGTQLNALSLHGYLTRPKNKQSLTSYTIVEARPIIEQMMREG